MDEFIEKYIKDDSGFKFPREIPVSILCDTLAAAATIRYLAHAGMHEMIDRCQRLELMRMQNPRLRYIRNAHRSPDLWDSEYFPVPKPPREQHQQANAVPISTVEGWAIRAIWQLLLIWELHSLVNGPSPCWNWPSEEVGRLQNMHFEELWRHALLNEMIEPIRTMDECSCLFPTLNPPEKDFMRQKILLLVQDGSFLVIALLPAPLLFMT